MKRTRIFICLLLACLTAAAAFVFTGARPGYELEDGAVVFNSADIVNYFSSSNNLSISYDSTENAAKLTVTTASDPYAHIKYKTLGANLSADEYKYIVVTYKIPSTVSSKVTKTEIFYATGSVTAATAGKSVLYSVAKDNTYHSQVVDMSSVSDWGGRINLIRFDCFTDASVGDTIYVDSIMLAKTVSEANEISAYRADKANKVIDDSCKEVIFDNGNYNVYLTTDTVETALIGDINLDKDINSHDSQNLKKYLACWSIEEIIASGGGAFDEEAADVNFDGIISIKDSLLLKKDIVGLIDLNAGRDQAVTSLSFENGDAKVTALSTSPYVNITYESETESMYTGQFKYLTIVYEASKSGSATIYGVTDKTDAESANAHSFNVIGDGLFHYSIIDLSQDSTWNGKIEGFKFDFFDSAAVNDYMYLDSVMLTETVNVANNSARTREAISNGYEFTSEYVLDISGQTLGQINTAETWQNVGYHTNGSDYHPFSASWPAAGYSNGSRDTLLVLPAYDNYVKVADCIDLSKYDSVTITYSSDNSFSTTASEFGFFPIPKVFGQGNSKHTTNLLFSVPLRAADSSKPSWSTLRTSTASVNSSYCGPLYLSYYMATGDGSVVTEIKFHLKNPEYETLDTVNNREGSTVYTVAGDASTISVGGVTYPNKINYTSGVTIATDDVSRTLITANASSANGGHRGYDFEEKNVGIFYFLWLGSHGTGLPSGGQDIQKIVNSYGAIPGSSSKWLGNGTLHYFFSEPLYGYYKSDDEWVIRKHIEELTNADIDFIYFDVTNGVSYLPQATKVMKVIHEYLEMGYDAPKVVFYSNDTNINYTGSTVMLKHLYDNVYAKNLYPDTWFYYNGKPVIIGKQSEFSTLNASIQNFFTFRQSQWPNEGSATGSGYFANGMFKKNGGWSWMDFTDLPNPNKDPSGSHNEAINVSIAQHLGTVAFGDTGIYGFNRVPGGQFRFSQTMNHGRNWNGTTNADGSNYLAGNCQNGYNFQRQWNTVHNTYHDDLPVVLVTGWNEWAAGKIDTTGTLRGTGNGNYDMAWFVDTATVNYSRDIEMTKGYYFDNYYMQLIDNVRKYKGASPTLVQNKMKRIDVFGSFDQWNDITVSYRDGTGDTMARNTTGFGNISYVNNTGRNDIKSAKVVYDSEYLYFYVDCNSAISAYNTTSSWMQLYIDVDQSGSTGWYGYDYIVNYKAQGGNKTSVARCRTNGSRDFEITDSNIDYSVNNNMMMIRVPLSDLGFANNSNISFSFKWADKSGGEFTDMPSMYTDGDTMPHGRLNYVFTNN